MMPGLDPKMLKSAMKRMGIKQEEIDAEEVIIKCKDKTLIIKNPHVSRINAMGQQSIQVVGDIIEEKFSKEDIEIVMKQTGCSESEAKEALEREGDIAAAILSLKQQ